jgi:hypothetical protein
VKTKTIESLQQRLKAKGFNPGPIDGIDGRHRFAAPVHLSPNQPLSVTGLLYVEI